MMSDTHTHVVHEPESRRRSCMRRTSGIPAMLPRMDAVPHLCRAARAHSFVRLPEPFTAVTALWLEECGRVRE